MDNLVAAIWIKVGTRGRRPMILAAIYREHQLIFQQGPNDTGLPHKQLERWTKFVNTWTRAAARGDVTVIGT